MARTFGLIWSLVAFAAAALSRQDWPLHDDGLNQVVQWDHYSFEVNQQRLYVFAGEWHYWRIPVPEMWIDIMQKIKAAGFTGFSMYVSWGYHAPNNHTLDFTTGAHDFTPILKLAREMGLYVIFRPGPYMNAEANAGGYPLWVTTGEYGRLRDDDPRYTAAWTPYMAKVAEISSNYQVTNNQSIISFQVENEFGEQWKGDASKRVPNEVAIHYMELLEETAREHGIDVPLQANEPNMHSISWGKDWSNEGGNVDVTGLDVYPSCWTCDISVCSGTNGAYIPYKVVDVLQYFEETQQTMPSFLSEFQGGSYNPWGGPEGGCPDDIGTDFANLFYRWNIGQRVTAVSFYDYSAPISEDRSIGAKYYETKLLALFTRAAKDLTVTDLIGNGTSYSTNTAIQAYELRNPNTGAGFYVTLHANSSSAADDAFQLHVNTSAGQLSIPQHGGAVRLNGHQSKIVVTDFRFGSYNLLYSTAEVLTYAVFDGEPTLVLWVPTGESGEFSIETTNLSKNKTMASNEALLRRCKGCSAAKFFPGPSNQGVTVSFTQDKGMSIVQLNSVRVVLLDRTSAYNFWAPSLSSDPVAPEDKAILVQGPHLVREAKLEGSTVILTGDSSSATRIHVFAPQHVKKISWNGKALATCRTSSGGLQASWSGPLTVGIPPLGGWKHKDSLPEKRHDYDDTGAAWAAADHMSTSNPTQPVTLPVLYADEYGFHNGVRLWRGYFTGQATGVYLNIQGGNAFGWSAWLNGAFVGSFLGNASLESVGLELSFDSSHINNSSQNVLLVVHDDSGHDEVGGALNPRGIIEASLLSRNNATKFSSWRVAGTAGAESNLDPVRGVYNEGGLYAERMGWHLPGFDDDKWAEVGNNKLVVDGPGVEFFRTVMPLNIPRGVDVSISFQLGVCGSSKAFRAQLFVNGYQYGRFNPWIGNQVTFPVPPGVLNYRGDNTIGFAVWSQTKERACAEVDWKINYVLDSSLDVTFDGDYLRTSWTKERLQFA